jgi:hypothetical protein
MDWLKRLGGFLGGVGNQAQRTIGGIGGGANQAFQQAQRAFRPVAQQVQRNIPRPPVIPKIQVPVIPKIQLPPIPQFRPPAVPQFRPPALPQPPKIDFNAVNQALSNYYGRTALSKTPENLQNIGRVVSPVVRSFSGATGEGLNTLRSAPAAANVLTAAQIEILGKAIGNKSIENKANLARQKAFAEYARQSQTGINPVGSAQQIAIDKGGLSGLGAFTKAFGTKGLKAGLEIAPAVTGAPAGASVLSTLVKGGTLGAGGNVAYSGLSGSYRNKSAKDLALQAAADVGMGYGGELAGIGLNKVIGKAGSALLAQKGLTPQLPSMYGKAAIGQDVPASYLKPKAPQAGGAPLDQKGLTPQLPKIDVTSPEALSLKPKNVAISKLKSIAGDRELALQDYNAGRYSMTDLPVLVKIEKNGSLTVLDGNGRIIAAQQAGQTNIPITTNEKLYREILDAREKLPSMYGKGTIGQDVPASYLKPKAPQVGKQDPLEALKAEARKYKSADEFVQRTISQETGFKDSHVAPGFDSTPVKKKMDTGGDFSLKEVANGYSNQPSDYFDPKVGARYYGYDNLSGRQSETAINNIIRAEKNGITDRTIIAYRTVPKDAKVSKLENNEWVTFSEEYAKQHGLHRFDGKYKIIKQEVKPTEVWWDGNDINEWGFDNGKGGGRKTQMAREKELTDLYNQAKAPQVAKTDLPSMYGKGSIGQDVPESFLQPKSPTAQQVPLKASGIAKSLEKSGSKIYADIPGYVPVKNKALLNISENRVALDERAVINSIVNRQPNQPVTPQMNADSVYLLNKLLKEGRDDEALAIAKATAKNATSAGRAVQILSRLQQTTPEGALVKAQKIVNEVNDKAGKQIVTLDAKNQEDIIALANQVQKYKPDTREYQKAAGELMKYIENLKPVSRGAKVSMIQTMAQLLNPKTAIRNVVGNLGMSVGEDIASIPAALLDRIVSIKTGIRTTSISNPIVGVKGAIKGSKYGVEDTKLGIKTLGSQTKFDIRPDVFKKGIMKKLQNALGYELGVPDKAFYQSAFDKTLDSVMRANKTKTPTAEMLDIANAEALYATFQNNSAIGNALQKTKGVLNLGKDFGAGDFIIKYPKTPGNIVSVGLDYSPIGIGKGITSLARNLSSMTPSVQREAVRNIGRGITGTGAIAMGVILAQNGIITGRKDSDRDIAALDREQGMGPFTFNATALLRLAKGEDTKVRPGDVVANYDWLQPAAIQLSMGANAVLNVGKGTDNLIGDALESIGDSANTVVEQPVLQGVSRFINNLNPQYGGGIGKAVTDVASGIPSSFVPGSLNQIGQLFDNTARSTYDPNVLAEALNKVKGRLPGARTTLQPSVTTLGQPRELYQDRGNNIFNVFFNPAFVKTIKDNEVYKLVKDIQDRSGEAQQAPRAADKKIKINGQDKKLSAEEYNRYQTYIGQKTNETFTNLANDTRFNALSDVDKAKYMSGKLTDINAAAKDELFGNKPTSGGDTIKAGELGYETKPPKVKISKPKKVSKGRKGRAATKGRAAAKGRATSFKMPKIKKVTTRKAPASPKAPKVGKVKGFAKLRPTKSARKTIKIKTG